MKGAEGEYSNSDRTGENYGDSSCVMRSGVICFSLSLDAVNRGTSPRMEF